MKVLAYQKQSDDPKVLDDFLSRIDLPGCTTCTVFTDSDRDFIAYREMKKAIADEDTLLIVSCLRDLGHMKQQVLAELEYYWKAGISVVIAEYPSMQDHLIGEANRAALAMLIDTCRTMMDDKVFSINDAAKSRNGGRRKLAFPDQWEELYAAWKGKEITAAEFMRRSGLKKGTFYHLVSEYSQVEQQMVVVREIS